MSAISSSSSIPSISSPNFEPSRDSADSPSFPQGNNRALAAHSDCLLYDDQSVAAPAGQGRGTTSTRSLRNTEATETNSIKAFIAGARLTPCPHENTVADGIRAGTVHDGDGAMRNRVNAYKKMIDDVDVILGAGDKPDSTANPLTVRAWFFNIGMAFGTVDSVLKEAEAAHCSSREERTEKILEIFRKHKILVLAGNAITTKQPAYTEAAALEKAEQLVRYAFNNSIT
jgi:hypothetical protein